MAANSPDAILIAAGFTISTAPVGTTLPADVDDTLDSAFTTVGYTTDDGATFTRTPSVNPINAHQSFEPVRYVLASIESTISFTMMQWDADTIPLAFGGGEWAVTANGWEFRPAEPGVLDERCLVADAIDGDTKWRIVMTRGMQQGASSSTLTKAGSAGLAVTFGALAAGAGTKSWRLLTDSTEVNPTVSA